MLSSKFLSLCAYLSALSPVYAATAEQWKGRSIYQYAFASSPLDSRLRFFYKGLLSTVTLCPKVPTLRSATLAIRHGVVALGTPSARTSTTFRTLGSLPVSRALSLHSSIRFRVLTPTATQSGSVLFPRTMRAPVVLTVTLTTVTGLRMRRS